MPRLLKETCREILFCAGLVQPGTSPVNHGQDMAPGATPWPVVISRFDSGSLEMMACLSLGLSLTLNEQGQQKRIHCTSDMR